MDNQVYDYLARTEGVCSVISTVICGIAIITSYIFPLQRRFPGIVLVWTWYVEY